ncbi:MAG: hypothetical protein U1F43_35100 [Myxococcota bacterium]
MPKIRPAIALSLLVIAAASARVEALPTGPATATLGADECRAGSTQPACRARPFVRSADLAWSGNGFARPAVAKDTIAGFAIHDQAHVNDGYYGNGASWVSASADAWVKIDLGRLMRVDGVRLGRDRTGGFNDRGSGGFAVLLATTDAVYAAGNAADDASEYMKVVEASAAEVAAAPAGATFVAAFTPTIARFVKVQLKASGAALDEIEVSGAVVEEDACVVSPCAANMACTDRPGPDTGPDGRSCACKSGFRADDGGACVDVDECAAGSDGCVEGCRNQIGAFTCIDDPAWTSTGDAGFPEVANSAFLTVAADTTLTAVRVPSSALTGPSRLVVTALPTPTATAVTVAVGATVAPSSGSRTVLPLPCSLFPGRLYQISIESGDAQVNLVTGVPLARASFQRVATSWLALAPPTNRERTAVGGVRARAYEVKVNAETSISGVRWIVLPCPGKRLEARIWDAQGALLARGLPVLGPDQTGPVTSPLTFTFEVGRTYLVGIFDESGTVQIPFKDLGPDAVGLPTVTGPYTTGGLTVSAVRSSPPIETGARSSPPGDPNPAPLSDNVFGPLIELVLTPACAEGTCH